MNDLEQLEQLSKAFFMELVSGRIVTLHEALAPKAAQSLSLFQLCEIGQQMGWLTGELQSVKMVQSTSLGELVQVSVVGCFAKGQLTAHFIFNTQKQLQGFRLESGEQQKAPYQLMQSEHFQEIPIAVGAIEPKLDGVLTLPTDIKRPPVVVMVQGSGQSDYNETIGGAHNKPFADLAHGLAEWGIASIRYHKRFFQHPPQSAEAVAAITVEQEVTDDVQAAIQWAVADERLDSERIYGLGHSMGGYLMPRIAADNDQLRGMIVMAGPFRSVPVILAEQKRCLLEMNTFLSPKQKAQANDEIDRELARLADNDEQATVFGQPMLYWNSLKQDQHVLLAQLERPILILQGENDFQVDGQQELAWWRQALKGKAQATFCMYPGLSHLLMPAPDRQFDMSLYDQPAHVHRQVIADIAHWIAQN